MKNVIDKNERKAIEAEQKEQLIHMITQKFGPGLLDKKHLQIIFGFSASTINRMIINSQIPYVKIGDKSAQVKFITKDVVDMIFENRVEAFNSIQRRKF